MDNLDAFRKVLDYFRFLTPEEKALIDTGLRQGYMAIPAPTTGMHLVCYGALCAFDDKPCVVLLPKQGGRRQLRVCRRRASDRPRPLEFASASIIALRWAGLEPEGPAKLDPRLGDAPVKLPVLDRQALVEHEEEIAAGDDDPAQTAVDPDLVADVVVLGQRGPGEPWRELDVDADTGDVDDEIAP